MPTTELVDYIHDQTQQGVTAQDLRVSLMEAGWLETDITNALHDVAAGLHPATPGASIHEDLAQVRTVVANLASRVHGLEAALASVGAIETQQLITAGPVRHRWLSKVLFWVTGIGIVACAGGYTAQVMAGSVILSSWQLIMLAVAGALILTAAIIILRHHSTRMALLLTLSAVSLWAMVSVVAWRVHHSIEWTTALGLAVLLVVMLGVVGSWIRRFSVR